jgi:aquaporin Z
MMTIDNKSTTVHRRTPLLGALEHHWPEYAMEAFALGLFMVSACLFSVVLEHPSSPVRQLLPNAMVRRAMMGLAMGLTNVLNVYSPWGKQSGAHVNPSVTLTFFRLGKVKGADALFYCMAQFIGGVAGTFIAAHFLKGFIEYPTVNYAATVPGVFGIGTAFLAEVSISCLMMSVILRVSNTDRIARYTGLFAGLLVACFITFEAPLSGMSMNPARTLGSAAPANIWTALWIYFAAPPLGMALAAEIHLKLRGPNNVICAKLHHQNSKRCIFCGAGTHSKNSEPQTGIR